MSTAPQPHETRARLDALATTANLVPWQTYAIDDEAGALAIATGPSSYSVHVVIGPDGLIALPAGGGVMVGGVRIIGPRQPQVNDPTGQEGDRDGEARYAISQINAVLRAHGLTE